MADLLSDSLELISKLNAEWVGLREVREKVTHRAVRDGRPEANERTETHGVMVEVFHQGQFAYASTSTRSPHALFEAAQQAKCLAEEASQHALFSFSLPSVRPPIRDRYETSVTQPIGNLPLKDLTETLLKISDRLKITPEIIRTTALAFFTEAEMRFASTHGSRGEQNFSFVSVDFDVVAEREGRVQKRSDGGYRGRSYQGGLEYLWTQDFDQRVKHVADQALELLSAEVCPTLVGDLLLMPDQMMLQIHESIGHPLELDRILGDERNYAGWSFVKPTDFGHLQYGSPLLNVTFDPTIKHELASYAFDDIGQPARREYLIKEGRLERGLGSLESQARLKIPGVANQRACSWNRPPIDRMANLNLEPGTSSWNEMIESVEEGVLMETNRSWSIDDFRNKFQFGCEYAKLIRNGKIVKTLRNPNYRGVSVPFWKSLKKVGDASTFGVFGTPNCGKGEPNQVIRCGHASPACLFEKIEIFGGES